jgi:hypothetical protein
MVPFYRKNVFAQVKPTTNTRDGSPVSVDAPEGEFAASRRGGDPPVRGVALASFLVCDPMSPLYNSHSRVTVAEIAGRARAALSPG